MTGTMAGADAFWVERVKKEVKTQMIHQEHFREFGIPVMIDFYRQTGTHVNNKQATSTLTRYRKAKAEGLPQASHSAARATGTYSAFDRRASTPNRLPKTEQQALQAAKSKQMYLNLIRNNQS